MTYRVPDTSYIDFLRKKIRLAEFEGFDVQPEEVNPLLKAHQRDIVIWAVRGGCRAIFAAFGLGKSVIQVEILRLVQKYAGGLGLIVLPLGVRQEFKKDGMLEGRAFESAARRQGLDIDQLRQEYGIKFTFIRDASGIEPGQEFYLTNYESVRDGKLDPNLFTVVSLDEASVLRSFGSKTYQTFLTLFAHVKYRFVATATPSPNRYKELIHYGGFLGIMDTGQALTRFFQRDPSKANNLNLYPHKEAEFWLWLNSWAIFLQRPSDLGYSDEGYELPDLEVVVHEVASDHSRAKVDRDGQENMFVDAGMSLQDASAEKRSSLAARVEKMVEIIGGAPNDHFVLWHDLEDERRAIGKAVPESVAVYGAQDLDEREQAIVDFSDGKFKYLSAKPVIAGSGCNFQRHCHRAIFVGIGHKFNDFVQAIHRIQRFLQEHKVRIDIIISEAERSIYRDLMKKWSQHKKLVAEMTAIIKKHGLDSLSMSDVLTRTIGVERIEVTGEHFVVANNDCVLEAQSMTDNSVDLIVTSIPFANHYEYTPSYNDFGHTEDNTHFWRQMDYLTPELYRVLKPGRLACIHVKDRILFGNVTGAGVPTVSKFHNEAAAHFAGLEALGIQGHGFDYLGMITINTDVVRENNQTYRLGWSEQCKDGTKMGVGSPEYVLLFHKPQSNRAKGYADTPVRKKKGNTLSYYCSECGHESHDDAQFYSDPPDPDSPPRCPECGEEFPAPDGVPSRIEEAGYTRARWQVDAHAHWRSSGNRLLTADELATLGPDKLAKAFTEYTKRTLYDYEFHVRIGEELERRGALPSTFMSLMPAAHGPYTWHDVNRMMTLNGEQSQRGLQNHVCPLQVDIVDRLITRFSNKGETVFDPFGGLMTVPYRAIKLGRAGRASELNPGYFFDGVHYCQAMEKEVGMPDLFGMLSEDLAEQSA